MASIPLGISPFVTEPCCDVDEELVDEEPAD